MQRLIFSLTANSLTVYTCFKGYQANQSPGLQQHPHSLLSVISPLHPEQLILPWYASTLPPGVYAEVLRTWSAFGACRHSGSGSESDGLLFRNLWALYVGEDDGRDLEIFQNTRLFIHQIFIDNSCHICTKTKDIWYVQNIHSFICGFKNLTLNMKMLTAPLLSSSALHSSLAPPVLQNDTFTPPTSPLGYSIPSQWSYHTLTHTLRVGDVDFPTEESWTIWAQNTSLTC